MQDNKHAWGLAIVQCPRLRTLFVAKSKSVAEGGKGKRNRDRNRLETTVHSTEPLHTIPSTSYYHSIYLLDQNDSQTEDAIPSSLQQRQQHMMDDG